MTLTLNTHILLSTYLVVCIYLCSGHRLQLFRKHPLFSFFPMEKTKFPNLTCCKIDQGQPRVIISTYNDGLESQMLHTKKIGRTVLEKMIN